jgi:hypothetical protein
VQLALSFKMIDTFRGVLQRKDYDPVAVDAAAQALVAIIRYGPRRLDPYVVFGVTPDPSLLDTEDGGVVSIANPIRWRLMENRAMLPLDVGFVQTDLWGGDRSATVARNARGRDCGAEAADQCAAACQSQETPIWVDGQADIGRRLPAVSLDV